MERDRQNFSRFGPVFALTTQKTKILKKLKKNMTGDIIAFKIKILINVTLIQNQRQLSI